MSKTLDINDMLEAAMECEHPDYDNLVTMMEEAADKLATALADHLDITKKNAADWEGKAFGGLCASFGPKHAGQPCPETIEDGDPGGDWDDPTDQVTLTINGQVMTLNDEDSKHLCYQRIVDLAESGRSKEALHTVVYHDPHSGDAGFIIPGHSIAPSNDMRITAMVTDNA